MILGGYHTCTLCGIEWTTPECSECHPEVATEYACPDCDPSCLDEISVESWYSLSEIVDGTTNDKPDGWF